MDRNTLNYKNYLGSIESDMESKLLFGKIMHINDAIFYQGSTLTELQLCFEDALDEYLDTCNEIGKEPNKPCSGSFNVRIDPSLHRKAAMKSSRLNLKSLNLGVSIAIEEWVKENPIVRHVHTVQLDATNISIEGHIEYGITLPLARGPAKELH